MRQSLLYGLLGLSMGLGFASALHAQSASPEPSRAQPPYNCRTREVWSPEKRAWCDRAQALQNATYVLPEVGPVQLTAGQHVTPAGWVTSLGDAIAFGDVDGDRAEEAVVVLKQTRSGVAQDYLALMRWADGTWQNIDIQAIDPASQVRTVAIADRQVQITLNQPKQATQFFAVTEDKLVAQNAAVDPIDAPFSRERIDYAAVDLDELAERATLTGSDPRAIALAALGMPIEEAEGRFEQIARFRAESSGRFVVYLTQLYLLDDSVRHARYRIEFEPVDTARESRWRLTWAGRQQICQPGRGSQTWTVDFCQ
ncbi:hypothetical protein [Geitlerinema sp. PCC 7407]|uniref:hypothetical protein n=1 Tax=Geitlerinema sp. PCC 7407 TaxID=1173025 RepID=UPI00029FE4AD|nr:hypothetical protein [Geitlerinema sp. PCC 7407]AFY67785.1 hypothetical protein GEI7407_3318 [Geitlerinema sp. PCC 7407]